MLRHKKIKHRLKWPIRTFSKYLDAIIIIIVIIIIIIISFI